MFARVLLDHDEWRVAADWFGRGALRAVNRDNLIVRATTDEKQYVMQVLEAFSKAGVTTASNSPALIAALTDFAKAIHQRYRRTTTGGGFAYTVFFNTYPAAETARNYLDKFR
jgi:hypothetical protein